MAGEPVEGIRQGWGFAREGAAAMKLLLFYVHEFWMRPYRGNLPEAPEAREEIVSRDAVLALVHAESGDGDRRGKVVTRAIKNIKWLAGKFGTRRAILHYFAHLDQDAAPPELARDLVTAMAGRLESAGYEAIVTPYGHFTEFKLHVAGESLGKVFVQV